MPMRWKRRTPFDTIVDLRLPPSAVARPTLRVTTMKNLKEHHAPPRPGRLTQRSAVKLAEKIGINTVVDMAKRFGITTPLPPYLRWPRRRDMKLLDTSRLHRFSNDGIRIDPHMIRRVTSYDGALLEEAHPECTTSFPRRRAHHDRHAREVIRFGTASRPKHWAPAAGKRERHRITPMPVVGYTPQLTAGVWWASTTSRFHSVKETGARAALPIWLEFMQAPSPEPLNGFHERRPLEQQAGEHTSMWTRRIPLHRRRTPAPKEKPPAASPPAKTAATNTTGASRHL